MHKKTLKLLCILLCLGCVLTLFASCTDSQIGYFWDDENYVQFEGRITEFGIEITENYKYIWVKLESETDILNFDIQFQIVPNSYNELLENDCDLSVGKQNYNFVASKDPKRLNSLNRNRYCIIGVSDLDGNVYLDRKTGQLNLVDFITSGLYGNKDYNGL